MKKNKKISQFFKKAPTISNSSDHYNTYVQSNKYVSQY